MNSILSGHNSISGFTFIKNGLTLGYPIRESIESISPLCDEVVINVGFDSPDLTGDDGTYEYLQDHFPQKKYRFLKSQWNPESTKSGLVLSEQTNIALQACKGKYCQYIQGDEAIHQDDLNYILDGVHALEKNPQAQGLLFNYLHFYGSVDTYLHTRRIYRREIRLIKNHSQIVSHLDAQGFRTESGEKIKVLSTPARIFHYGWARQEKVMAQKIKVMDKLYHGKEFERQESFSYKRIWGMRRFKETHPEVMSEWIEKNKNHLDLMALPLSFHWKDVGLAISDGVESLCGIRFGEYKNFVLVGESGAS